MKSYRVPFDQGKLVLMIVIYLLTLILLPAICLYVSLNPLVIFVLLTICWFTLKALIRNCKRLIRRKPICELGQDITINSLNEDTKVMKWKDVSCVVYKEKRHSIQFLVYGNHIDHANGYYLIHINYPFTSKKLPDVKQSMIHCFEKHHIPVTSFEKEVNTNVSYSTKN